MSVNEERRARRAQHGPRTALCEQCEGHGTTLLQRDAKVWWVRATAPCLACQETGLKGIPESEVNEGRYP